MKCRRCGKEINNSTRCSFCGYDNFEESNVREMSSAEKNFYNGVTIDVSSDGKSYNDRRENDYTSYQSTYVNFGGTNILFNLLSKLIGGLFKGSLLAKIIAGVIFLAFAAFMFFVALPIFFVLVAGAVVVLIVVPYIKNKFFGRRLR
ncbi:MAG: hypothetical protein IJU91_06260 [Selenomonadaceae bacterium]|nr:hypothetical protein [Selenomonadaceae bacterium]